MKDAFNPTKRPWNAVGDGVTGDTATYDTIAMHNTIAIQKCLDAAKTKHKDVYIPAGTYLVSGPLTIPSGLAVYGDGPGDDGTILLHQPASAGVDLLHLNEATDVHISGLCLKSRHERHSCLQGHVVSCTGCQGQPLSGDPISMEGCMECWSVAGAGASERILQRDD